MPAYLLFSFIVGFFTYILWTFIARISASIPYAGEGSLISRLKIPVEYTLDPPRFLNRQRKILGDIFCVDLIVTKIVFVLGPKASREFLRAPATELDSWEVLRQAFGPNMAAGPDEQENIASSPSNAFNSVGLDSLEINRSSTTESPDPVGPDVQDNTSSSDSSSRTDLLSFNSSSLLHVLPLLKRRRSWKTGTPTFGATQMLETMNPTHLDLNSS